VYLSQLLLDRRNPSVIQSLRNCHDMHRTIMKAFPEHGTDQARKEFGVLYRVLFQNTSIWLYVLSEQKPDWPRIFQNGYIAKGCKDISGVKNAFREGRSFLFDILLQPSKKLSRPDGNSRRVTIGEPEEREQWLQRKARESGFRLEWYREEGKRKISGYHSTDRGGPLHLDAIRYRGVLTIEDDEKFINAYRSGIGPGKAYGLGMLLLAKA